MRTQRFSHSKLIIYAQKFLHALVVSRQSIGFSKVGESGSTLKCVRWSSREKPVEAARLREDLIIDDSEKEDKENFPFLARTGFEAGWLVA